MSNPTRRVFNVRVTRVNSRGEKRTVLRRRVYAICKRITTEKRFSARIFRIARTFTRSDMVNALSHSGKKEILNKARIKTEDVRDYKMPTEKTYAKDAHKASSKKQPRQLSGISAGLEVVETKVQEAPAKVHKWGKKAKAAGEAAHKQRQLDKLDRRQKDDPRPLKENAPETTAPKRAVKAGPASDERYNGRTPRWMKQADARRKKLLGK